MLSRVRRPLGAATLALSLAACATGGGGMAGEFDAVIHLDQTRALDPLDGATRGAESDAARPHPTRS